MAAVPSGHKYKDLQAGEGGVMQSQSHEGWKSLLRSPSPNPHLAQRPRPSVPLLCGSGTPPVSGLPRSLLTLCQCTTASEKKLLPAPSWTVPLSPCATCHHWAPEERCAGAAAALPIPIPSLSSLRGKKPRKQPNQALSHSCKPSFLQIPRELQHNPIMRQFGFYIAIPTTGSIFLCQHRRMMHPLPFAPHS